MMTGLCAKFIFIFLRYCYSVFHSGWATSHAHQQWIRVPFFFPSPHQYLLFVYFCMWAIVNGLRWNFIVVLICVSLITSNLEHYFKCLLANCISLLEKPVQALSHFVTGVFVVVVVVVEFLELFLDSVY